MRPVSRLRGADATSAVLEPSLARLVADARERDGLTTRATVLAVVGGVHVAVGGVAMAFMGAMMGMMGAGMPLLMPAWMTAWSLATGGVAIWAGVRFRDDPAGVTAWVTAAIVAGAASYLAMGGFLVGGALVVAAGILALVGARTERRGAVELRDA